MEINMGFFVSGDQIQTFFDEKGLKIKMSLEFFHKVPTGAIEMLFNEQNQPLFKRADLGKYLGIEDMKHNLKDFPSHCTRRRSETEARSQAHPPSPSLEGQKVLMISSLVWMVL